MSSSSLAGAASASPSSSPQVILEKLTNACKRVEQVTKDSKEAQDQFMSTYQAPFRDLFMRVGTLARERKELTPLLDHLEAAWKSALPTVAVPKLVPKKKALEIFPQTSFEDALKLVDKHLDDTGALMTIVRYLQGILEETKPKKLKSLPYQETIDKVLKGNPAPPLAEAYSKLLKACEDKLFDFNINESLRVGADQKRLETLKKIEAPTGPQQRAMEALSKSVKPSKTQSPVGNHAQVKSSSSLGAQAKKPAATSSMSSSRPLQSSSKRPTTSSSKKRYSDSEDDDDYDSEEDEDGRRRRPPMKKKKPMSQAEFEREFLRRARESALRDEMEDRRSRMIGAYEDAHADSE